MQNECEELSIEMHHLQSLQKRLDKLYYRLGKKTQEFVEMESGEINQLVDEIVESKKKIAELRQNSSSIERHKV